MVEDRITSPRRIAQLLASELTGLRTGPLSAVAVSDADVDAAPSSGGTRAYVVTFGGDRYGEVLLYDDHVALVVGESPPDDAALVPSEREDVRVTVSGGTTTITVASGAGVKRAVDTLRSILSD